MTAQDWHQRGQFLAWRGHKVFYVDSGGSKPPLCVLHGYPSSSHDYWRVWPILAEHFRLVVHDHLGFGFSAKPKTYSYALLEQAELALHVWQELGLERVHVLAHDYGTSVATELMARREAGGLPVEVRSLTLCNGSVHIEFAGLRIVQKLLLSKRWGPTTARLMAKPLLRANLRRLWADPAHLADSDVDAMWDLIQHNNGQAVFHAITQYLAERRRFWHRWIPPLTRLGLSAHVLWGLEDPVAVPKIAHTLAGEIPGATATYLEGIGHYPMLEAPETWAQAALNFYHSLES